MATDKEELTTALDGLYETIKILAQQLSLVVHLPDFTTKYEGRLGEIQRVFNFFWPIRRSKREKVREAYMAMRNGVHVNLESLVYRVKRSKIHDTVARVLSDCVWIDQELFKGSARPPEWENVMGTVHKLQNEEQEFYQLSQKNEKAWDQLQIKEETEDWQKYDFVVDPTLLGNVASLLEQLKLLA